MSKQVFVSYRADEEGSNYKSLLVAWSKNDNGNFDIKFDDKSVGISLNSDDASQIKTVIKRKISESNVFLCLVGENTHSSDWVNWEIVAVKIKSTYVTPIELYGVGAKWAMSFTYEAIKKAIDG